MAGSQDFAADPRNATARIWLNGDLVTRDQATEGALGRFDATGISFDNAKRLYNQRLLPMLDRQHGVTWEAIKLGQADATAASSRATGSAIAATSADGMSLRSSIAPCGMTSGRNRGSRAASAPARCTSSKSLSSAKAWAWSGPAAGRAAASGKAAASSCARRSTRSPAPR